MSVERQTMSGLRWTAMAKIVGQAISWAVTLIVLRLLVPSDYGLMAMVAVIISLLSSLAELGLGASLVQAAQLEREEVARVSGAIVLLNIGAGLLMELCAPLAAIAFHQEQLTALTRVAGLQFFLNAIGTVPQAMAYRQMNFRWLSTTELWSVAAGSLATLGLAVSGAGVWALVLGNLTGIAVRTGLLLRAGTIRPVLELRGLGKHLRFGGMVTLSRLAWQVVYQSDTMIAGRMLPSAAVGLYSVSLHVATLPMQKIMSIVNQVALPAVARLQSDMPRLRRRVIEASRLMTFFSVSTMWGLSAVAPEFVDVVMGPSWAGAVYPLQVICCIVPLRMLSVLYNTAVLGIGLASVDLRNTLLTSVVLPAAFLIGVHWGVNGLATSWIVALPIIFLANFPRITNALGIRAMEVAASTWPSVVAGALMYGAIASARFGLMSIPAFGRLPLLVLLGAATYLGLLSLIDRRMYPDVRAFLIALKERQKN